MIRGSSYWANWYYLDQLVGNGGICFVVEKKCENNVAHFYMAHVSVQHMFAGSLSPGAALIVKSCGTHNSANIRDRALSKGSHQNKNKKQISYGNLL